MNQITHFTTPDNNSALSAAPFDAKANDMDNVSEQSAARRYRTGSGKGSGKRQKSETSAIHSMRGSSISGLGTKSDANMDVDTSQMRRLLNDFVSEDEEPADLDGHDGIPPVEQRLRARSHRPGVTSVPDDIHSSILEPGGKTVLLTPCQEIILARRIENGDHLAKDALVNSNLRLVTSIAQRYQGQIGRAHV